MHILLSVEYCCLLQFNVNKNSYGVYESEIGPTILTDGSLKYMRQMTSYLESNLNRNPVVPVLSLYKGGG